MRPWIPEEHPWTPHGRERDGNQRALKGQRQRANAALSTFRRLWAALSSFKRLLALPLPVSYTHLTLPTICSV
eukprot:13697793-Alexandrium_andersonii.AAC.1